MIRLEIGLALLGVMKIMAWKRVVNPSQKMNFTNKKNNNVLQCAADQRCVKGVSLLLRAHIEGQEEVDFLDLCCHLPLLA